MAKPIRKNSTLNISRTVRLAALLLASSSLLSTPLTANPTGGSAVKPAGAANSASIVRIKNIETMYTDGGVTVRIHTGKRIPFEHQIVPAKNGKPFRIILDCQDADHALGANRFASLPKSVVTRIRTSQYAVTPKHITRVVLDLSKESFYRVIQADKHIDIFVTDHSAKRFNTWSSAAWLAQRTDQQEKAAPAKPQVKSKTVVAKAAVTSPVAPAKSEAPAPKPVVVAKADQSASKAGKQPKKASKKIAPDKKTIPVKPVVKTAPKPKASLAPVSVADNASQRQADKKTKSSENSSAKQPAKKPVAKKTETEKKALASSSSAQKKSAVANVTKKSSTPARVAQKKAEAKAPAKSATLAKANSSANQEAKVNSPAKKAKQQVDKSSSPVTALAKKVSAPAKTSAVKSAAKSKKPAAAKSKEKAKPTQTLASKSAGPAEQKAAEKPKNAAKAKKSSVKPSVPTVAKKEKKKSSERSLFASTANAATKPPASKSAKDSEKAYSAKFRSALADRRAVKLKGTQVAEFPKRLTIKYKSKSSRDPFASLFKEEKREDGPFTNVPPNVEALTMVGVLRDVNGRTRGLFEDIDGRGYILAKGDKIKNGTVLKVTETKAYFQIFEYGWSRTVALSLDG